MAQVFKFKFRDTVRRWVAPNLSNADSITLTFKDLESKIGEFFHLSSTAWLSITYVDRDNDVVTLVDDQGLIDACIVQGLNPLRLDVVLLDDSSKEHAHDTASFRAENPFVSAGDVGCEDHLRRHENSFWGSRQGFERHGYGHPRSVKRLPGHTHAAPPSYSINSSISAGESKEVQYWKNFGSALRNSQRALVNHHPGHLKAGGDPFDHHDRGQDAWTLETILHWGIECDGCGISPIEGPRYRSIKASDFDLCKRCFKAWGNETDYVKFDWPAHHPPRLVHHPPHHGHYRPPFHRSVPRPLMVPPSCRASFGCGPYNRMLSCPLSRSHINGGLSFDEQRYLDAQFVKDVTIFDGTELPPGIRFTKIWRLSNSGSLPWPQGTQLAHIGGDFLGTGKAVILELPESGVPCGEEAEVSVDLFTPEKAGRYVSHWRLSAQCGQKFGHRMWVVIQVVTHGEHFSPIKAPLKDGKKTTESKKRSEFEDIHDANTKISDVNLNLADKLLFDAVFDGKILPKDQQNDYVNMKLMDASLNGADEVLIKTVVHGETLDGRSLLQTPGPKAYEENTEIMYHDLASMFVKVEQDKPKFEDDGFSLIEKPNEGTDWFDVSQEVVDECERQKGRSVEELLLHALESMYLGTKSCRFELESTVDKLVLAAGWNTTLKILQEMGFTDRLTNVRLLVKNKGSLKYTVKELVELEKQ